MLLKFFKILLNFYRLIFSPLLHLMIGAGFGCRFEPTCSRYATEALEAHGPVYGVFLSFKRICRCNPLARAGYDPVPRAIGKPYCNYN
ncbi:MAG: membrane protein insertion efficiency factor YidD [Bdellovibrionia bacterium]